MSASDSKWSRSQELCSFLTPLTSRRHILIFVLPFPRRLGGRRASQHIGFLLQYLYDVCILLRFGSSRMMQLRVETYPARFPQTETCSKPLSCSGYWWVFRTFASSYCSEAISCKPTLFFCAFVFSGTTPAPTASGPGFAWEGGRWMESPTVPITK